MSIYSDEEDAQFIAIWQSLSSAARDTLKCLVYKGPCWDGDVPSKSGRDELLDKNLASKAVVKKEQGYQVANYLGWMVYRVGNPIEFERPADVAERAIRKAADT